jgi:hypothetical protein
MKRFAVKILCLITIGVFLVSCNPVESFSQTIAQIFTSIKSFDSQLVASHLTATSPKEAKVLAIQIRPKFKKCVDELKKITSVPIILPALFPYEVDIEHPINPDLSILIGNATDSNYSLTFGITTAKNCFHGVIGRSGKLTGEKITSTTKTAIQIYEELHGIGDSEFHPYKSPEQASYVLLARDIEGYFIPFIGGASASDSLIVWDQNGYRYSVGFKAGRLNDLVYIANSTIENQP